MVKKLSLLLFFTLLFTSTCLSQEVVVSSRPHNYRYLVFVSSMTDGNKTTMGTLIVNTKNNPQPSARWQCMYNSTSSLFGFSDFKEGNIIKYDPSSTRLIITLDAQYDSTIQLLITAGKVKKLACLWEVIFDDLSKKLVNAKRMELQEYINYPVTKDNKDWCLKDFTVDTSTH